MGSVFESWANKNYQSIGGKNELLGKKTFKNVQGTAKEPSDITFDDHYMPNDKTFVGQEIKSGAEITGEELEQSKRYNDIIVNATTHGYDKVFIEYIFLSEDAARKSLVKLQKDTPQNRLKVFYVDDGGKMISL